MRVVQKLPSARSLAPIGRWAPAVAVGFVIAICSSARSQTGGEAVYAVTYLDVAASSLGRGVDLLKQYRESSRHEAANLEFIVLQETGRPNRFAIVEGWKDQSAFDAHQKARSTAQFEEALKAIRNSPPNQHVLHAFATGSARAERPSGALYMVEHIDFLPMFANLAQPAEGWEVIGGSSLELKVAGPSMLGIGCPGRHALPLTPPQKAPRVTRAPIPRERVRSRS